MRSEHHRFIQTDDPEDAPTTSMTDRACTRRAEHHDSWTARPLSVPRSTHHTAFSLVVRLSEKAVVESFVA